MPLDTPTPSAPTARVLHAPYRATTPVPAFVPLPTRGNTTQAVDSIEPVECPNAQMYLRTLAAYPPTPMGGGQYAHLKRTPLEHRRYVTSHNIYAVCPTTLPLEEPPSPQTKESQ